MEIKIEYNSDVVGKGVFWSGDSMKVGEISNIFARMLALNVRLDGKTRKSGMWTVSVIDKSTH
jgi:hypothetical protein